MIPGIFPCTDNPAVHATRATPSAPHIVLYSEEKLNITITQNMIATWDEISSAFAQAKGGIPSVPANTRELTVLNDIGHASRVELLVQEQVNRIQLTYPPKSFLQEKQILEIFF